jgi:RHS repeat-associated protein
VRTISEGGAEARFAYDPFGVVQELDVQGGADKPDQRRDRRYGDFIERREVKSGGSSTSVIIRHFPGDGGIVASRRGTGNDWVFNFGEQRGNRIFSDAAGAFIQRVDYQPFGEATSSGAPVGSLSYTSYQWNGGDNLGAFGVAQLGARIYDLIIGRFLGRDPLLIPRGAATTNPYAFAMNDPVNGADPSGLDCNETGCPWTPLLFGDSGGGGGNLTVHVGPSGPPTIKQFGNLAAAVVTNLFMNFVVEPVLRERGRASVQRAWSRAMGPSPADIFLQSKRDATEFTLRFAYDHLIRWPFGMLLQMPDDSGGITQSGVPSDEPPVDLTAADAADKLLLGPPGVGGAGVPGPRGDASSVAFETELDANSYPGVSRAAHFQEANENLLQAMESDPQFAQTMQDTGVKLQRTPTGLAPRRPPAGWTWHHADEPGVMQLVPREQHTPGSIFWSILHPGNKGGYAIWGKK